MSRGRRAAGLVVVGLLGSAAGSTAGSAAGSAAGAPRRVDLVAVALDRIATEDSRLRATVTVLSADARRRAAEADRAGPVGERGPLDGLPVTVKDNIEVAGVATSAGAVALQRLGPVTRDAPVVARLRAAGAIVVATTNLDTWARGVRGRSEVRGQTVNPVRPGRNAGGSSAGAAASVAAGWVPLALGTDTCGSIRYPAAATGLVGLRPGSGVLSRAGVVPLSPTQDTVGVIAADPSLIAAALTAMAGPDARDPAAGSTALAPDGPGPAPRIGVVLSMGRWRVGADGTTVLDRLRAAGAVLVPVRLPVVPGASVIEDESLASRSLYLAARRAGDAGTGPDPWLDPLRLAAGVADQRGWRRRVAARAQVRDRLVDVLDASDLLALATPTSTADPAPLGARQASGNCHLSATSGLPAVAVPGPLDRSGVAVVGADLLGRPGSELALLGMAGRVLGASP